MNQLSFPQAQQSQQSITTPPLIYRIKQYQTNTLLSKFSYMLIRPPRFMYNEQLLTPPQNYQIRYKVQTFQIPFKLTLYKPQNMVYVILYLHGNSSSRFQGYMQLKDMPDNVGLACFDFNGCGMRFEADYITLGSKQSKEVDIAARFLKNLGYKVVGWGRSMGSVSLLLSQQLDILIADSPFSSLQKLCKQSTYKFIPSACCCFFHCFYPCLFSFVRSDVQQKAGFDIRQLQIAKIVANNPRNKSRSLFIMAGSQDHMIQSSHSQTIYNIFPGKKQIQIFQGTHNSNRPQETIQKAFEFIDKQLGIKRQASNKKYNNIKLKPINQKLQICRVLSGQGQEMSNNQMTIDMDMNIKKQEKQSRQSVKNIERYEEICNYNVNKDIEVSKNSNTITVDTSSKMEEIREESRNGFNRSPNKDNKIKQQEKQKDKDKDKDKQKQIVKEKGKDRYQAVKKQYKQQTKSPINTSQTLIPP